MTGHAKSRRGGRTVGPRYPLLGPAPKSPWQPGGDDHVRRSAPNSVDGGSIIGSDMTGPVPQPRKPVILTVDDDPAVSRAVARDLRRHYGERYRIVRAESVL